MLTHLRPAIALFSIITILTGIVYPLAITGIAQTVFPAQAKGSLILRNDGQSVGSILIGQEFGTSDPAGAAALAKWFWGRPSATSPVPYTSLNLEKATGSSGSNLAPSHPVLIENVKARIAALAAADSAVQFTRDPNQAIPVDLVTSSASGLDPHISIAAAEYQLPRVAKARGISTQHLQGIVKKYITPRTFGVLGEPVVNVVQLNLALQAQE